MRIARTIINRTMKGEGNKKTIQHGLANKCLLVDAKLVYLLCGILLTKLFQRKDREPIEIILMQIPETQQPITQRFLRCGHVLRREDWLWAKPETTW